MSVTPARGPHLVAAALVALMGACTAQGSMMVAAPTPPPRARAAYATTAAPPVAGDTAPGTETYQHRDENREVAVRDAPLSTFSIDVDTASYANIRRFLTEGRLPPADAVRVEEMINYFHYHYPDPAVGQPAAVSAEVSPSPFHPGRRLLRVGIQGRRPGGEKPPLNLVFLIDTSGSMAEANKLPLVVQGLRLLASHLGPRDHVGIVVYAGGAGVVLEPTGDREQIESALGRLSAGGSTNGGAGIQAAYHLAQQHLDPDAINRVVLCTDGDFNVGVTDSQALVKLIEDQRATGVYLTVLGVGTGNLKDASMEALAQYGNGNYGYVDSIQEAKKLLVDDMDGTLVTVAKDVKVQVEFNPARVASYRLIGYENRLLRARDFKNDAVDAGELGAGQTVTALYELEPAGAAEGQGERGGAGATGAGEGEGGGAGAIGAGAAAAGAGDPSGPFATVHLRYKPLARAGAPDRAGAEIAVAARDTGTPLGAHSADFRFAVAVAGMGMLLRRSEESGKVTWAEVQALARTAAGEDPLRIEAVRLMGVAASLAGAPATAAVAR